MDVKIGMNMLLWGVNITSEHIPVFEGLRAAGYDGAEVPVVGQPESELKAMRNRSVVPVFRTRSSGRATFCSTSA